MPEGWWLVTEAAGLSSFPPSAFVGWGKIINNSPVAFSSQLSWRSPPLSVPFKTLAHFRESSGSNSDGSNLHQSAWPRIAPFSLLRSSSLTQRRTRVWAVFDIGEALRLVPYIHSRMHHNQTGGRKGGKERWGGDCTWMCEKPRQKGNHRENKGISPSLPPEWMTPIRGQAIHRRVSKECMEVKEEKERELWTSPT